MKSVVTVDRAGVGPGDYEETLDHKMRAVDFLTFE